MDYTISISDELEPGIIAIGYAEGKEPLQVVQDYATAAAIKACQDMKVGPYYEGPIPPQFNADGTPYITSENLISPQLSTDETLYVTAEVPIEQE